VSVLRAENRSIDWPLVTLPTNGSLLGIFLRACRGNFSIALDIVSLGCVCPSLIVGFFTTTAVGPSIETLGPKLSADRPPLPLSSTTCWESFVVQSYWSMHTGPLPVVAPLPWWLQQGLCCQRLRHCCKNLRSLKRHWPQSCQLGMKQGLRWWESQMLECCWW